MTQGQCSDLEVLHGGGWGESGVSEADSKSYAFPLDFTERDLKTGHRDAKGPMAPATVLTDNKFLL